MRGVRRRGSDKDDIEGRKRGGDMRDYGERFANAEGWLGCGCNRDDPDARLMFK